ncbi:MAG TPA: SAM-dependent methyltransferase [Streptosporangiaceae bacterium]|nr:SAM-dependent methyltransferase [Streptosporangiaceae bacterium]
MTKGPDWRTNFRPDKPSAARIYDYLLGGKDNYPADREVARSMISKLPNVRLAVQWNRAYLRRVVRFLVGEAGIRQIIDIGAGLPTVGNTHEIAEETAPGTRVVYVDHDPVVIAHGRDMLQALDNTAIIKRDLVEPDSILSDGELTRLIDVTKPVAIMLLSMLHFLSDDDDPGGVIARLLAPFPSGSYVAISHATPAALAEVEPDLVKSDAAHHVHERTADQIRKLVDGLELVPPGLVWLPEWRPDPGTEPPEDVTQAYFYAVVARKA